MALQTASVKQFTELQSYIEKQDFVTIIGDIISDIFHLAELPENPYPLFLERLRAIELKNFTQGIYSEEIIKKKLENELSAEDPSTHTVHPRSSLDFFGLAHVIRWIDPPALTQLRSKVLNYANSEVNNEEGCHAIKICSLRGDCVFFDRLCPFYGLIEWCEDHIIENNDNNFEKSVALFVRRLIERVFYINSHESDRFLFVHIAASPSTLSPSTDSSAWVGPSEYSIPSSLSTVGDIKTQRFNASFILNNVKGFQKTLKTAIISKRPIFMEFLQCSDLIRPDLDIDGDPDSDRLSPILSYHHCRVHYVFHFKDVKGYVRSFTDYPGLSLLEGVFFSKLDADSYTHLYANYFTPNLKDLDRTEITLVPVDREKLLEFFYKLLNVALFESDTLGDFRNVLYVTFLMASLRMDANADAKSVETCRNVTLEFYYYHHSPAGLFYMPMVQATTLSYALNEYRDAVPPYSDFILEVMIAQYSMFVEQVRELLAVSSTSDYIGLSKRLKVLVQSLLRNNKLEPTTSCNVVLREIYQLARALSTAASSSMASLSKYSDIIIKEIYTRANKIRNSIPPIGFDRFVLQVDDMVKQALSTSNVKLPPAICRESVYMQYLITAEFDLTLSAALMEIFAGALVPNPFTALTIKFKIASLKFDNWKETDFFLLNSVIQNPRPERSLECDCLHRLKLTADSKSSNVPLDKVVKLNENEFLFGLSSVCHVLNSKVIKDLARDLFPTEIGLIPSILNPVEGSFSIHPIVSFAEETGLWGSLLDSLTFVTLNHTYIIDGPNTSAAADIFANQIISYLIHFHDFSDHIMIGLFLGYFSSFVSPPEGATISSTPVIPHSFSNAFDLVFTDPDVYQHSFVVDKSGFENVSSSAASHSKYYVSAGNNASSNHSKLNPNFDAIPMQSNVVNWCDSFSIARLKTEADAAVAAIRIAISSNYPIFALIYINAGGRYHPIRLDLNALFHSSNSEICTSLGLFPLHRLFDSIWIGHSESKPENLSSSNSYTQAFKSSVNTDPYHINALESARSWIDSHHAYFEVYRNHASDNLLTSNYFKKMSLFMKQQIVRAYCSGDLISAYKLLFRYQLQRNDTSGFALTRRLMISFAGQVHKLQTDGSHLLLLLRSMKCQNEVRLRIKSDVLVAQFLNFRELLYYMLNSAGYIFLVGLREAISNRMVLIFDRVKKQNSLEIENIGDFEEIVDMLHVICLSASNYFHISCTDQDALFTQFVLEIRQGPNSI